MTLSCKCRLLGTALVAAALAGIAAVAHAGDPPTRVGRIVLLEGAVSLHPRSDDQWIIPEINYPLTDAASLWTEQGARAEIEIGHARIHLDLGTALQVKHVDDRTVELAVPQGRIDIHLVHRRDDERYAVTTPRGTVTLEEDGFYGIIAGNNRAPTRIAAFAGRATLALPDTGVAINAGEEQDIASAAPLSPTTQAPTPDSFDQWSIERDRIFTAATPQYASPDMTGYQDLQVYGSWWTVPEYGVAWTPRQVPANWAPYSAGHWRSIAPWGWTWIDDQPWGFAPFHYGRWIAIAGTWVWVPGPVDAGEPPAYAPALVSFVAPPNTPPAAAPIAWVPLAPGELYQPMVVAAAPDGGTAIDGVSFVYFARLNPGARREALAGFDHDGAFRRRPPPEASAGVPANQGLVPPLNRDAFFATRPQQNTPPPPSGAPRRATAVGTVSPPPAPVAPFVNPVGPPPAPIAPLVNPVGPPPRLSPVPPSLPAAPPPDAPRRPDPDQRPRDSDQPRR